MYNATRSPTVLELGLGSDFVLHEIVCRLGVGEVLRSVSMCLPAVITATEFLADGDSPEALPGDAAVFDFLSQSGGG